MCHVTVTDGTHLALLSCRKRLSAQKNKTDLLKKEDRQTTRSTKEIAQIEYDK